MIPQSLDSPHVSQDGAVRATSIYLHHQFIITPMAEKSVAQQCEVELWQPVRS